MSSASRDVRKSGEQSQHSPQVPTNEQKLLNAPARYKVSAVLVPETSETKLAGIPGKHIFEHQTTGSITSSKKVMVTRFCH